MDFWVGSFCIFVLATVQIICFGWVWGLRNGAAELDQGALIKIPRFFLFVMKYIAPACLLVVLVGYGAQNEGPALNKTTGDFVGLWTLVIIVAVIGLLVGVLSIGERRWRAAGLDIDGRQT